MFPCIRPFLMLGISLNGAFFLDNPVVVVFFFSKGWGKWVPSIAICVTRFDFVVGYLEGYVYEGAVWLSAAWASAQLGPRLVG